MIIGKKDIFKMIGIMVMSCCAVFVCTLFLNYNMDLKEIEGQITEPAVKMFLEAQQTAGKVVSAVSGGCLLATTVIMLFFYIKHYIDAHRKELGILKALGFSNLKIARGFWVFGLSVFAGTGTGYLLSHLLMPLFYKVQNEDGILPEISMQPHLLLALFLVLLPTVLFAGLAVFYSCIKLKAPVLELLRGKTKVKIKKAKKESNLPFLQELRKNTVRQRASLVFFITFASFCFASMMQMGFGMDQIASEMFAAMMFLIGIVLASVSLLIATTTIVHSNTKSIAMMRVFGYPIEQCTKAILGVQTVGIPWIFCWNRIPVYAYHYDAARRL